MTVHAEKYSAKGTITRMARLATLEQESVSVESSASLLELARSRAKNPDIFDTHPPVFFEATISTGVYDAYSTRMLDSTLRNFADGAAAGVAVLDSHNNYELGFGRSLTGEVFDTEVNGEQTRAVRSWYYTIPGLGRQAQSGNPEAYIAGIESGIYNDVSVGFMIPVETGRMICSVCGGNMIDPESCPHLPGMIYHERAGKVVAKGDIDNGELNEYSPVYDGATPGAAITKALRMAAEGMIDEQTAVRATTLYGTRIVVPERRLWSGTGATRLDVDQPGSGEGKGIDMEFRENVLDGLRVAGVTIKRGASDEDVLAGLDSLIESAKALKDQVGVSDAKVAELETEKADLESLAEDGRMYRDDLVKAAVSDLVRTLPEDQRGSFNQDAQEKMLRSMPLETIKDLQKGWRAASRFKPGRGSEEGDPEEPETPAPRRVHRGAFSG